jgi:pimeloyl-ACP methyl ester carboxylesterase/DNA-binding CsgD family transcriptional regulator
MLDQDQQQADSQKIANNAIRTIPGSTEADISSFERYLEHNRFSPVARLQGLPVYRLHDYMAGSGCYMSDEKSQAPAADFSATGFAPLGNFLQFGAGDLNSGDTRESYVVSLDIINVAVARLGCTELTPAECRLAAQLLSGLPLKSAAADDNLSVETKKTQARSLSNKLNVKRQQDVIRVLLPELVSLCSADRWDREAQQIFNQYATEYLPASVRCQKLTDHQGREVRIIDFGPLRGKPVLVLHSMIFPDITDEDVQFACDKNIRLIWPVRPGLLQTSPTPRSAQQYAQETLHGIELAWRHLCGEPVQIIAMVSSAWHAATFAQLHPEKVSNVTFAATCFSAGKYENSLVYFGSSVAELCSRNTWLMTKTVDFLRRNVRDLDRFKNTICRVFRHSVPDMEVLNREFSSPGRGNRLLMAMVESPESVKHDYFSQVSFNWSELRKLQVPFRFVHGAQDSMHKIKDVKRMIAGIGDIPLEIFESGGHLMQYEHFHQLVSSCIATNTALSNHSTERSQN